MSDESGGSRGSIRGSALLAAFCRDDASGYRDGDADDADLDAVEAVLALLSSGTDRASVWGAGWVCLAAGPFSGFTAILLHSRSASALC